MATPVVVKPFRICPRWPLKNPKDCLTTFLIYNNSLRLDKSCMFFLSRFCNLPKKLI